MGGLAGAVGAGEDDDAWGVVRLGFAYVPHELFNPAIRLNTSRRPV